MNIIGVTGYYGSGKNTTTQILADHFGFQQYAFADALRRMALAINPVITLERAPQVALETLWQVLRARGFEFAIGKSHYRYTELIEYLSYPLAKEIPDFRHYLQKLGTEGARETFGPNAWVDALFQRIQKENPAKVAISDVRFESEADFVHRQGGEVWWVQRPGVGGQDLHPSETTIPKLPYDRIIIAETLEELERKVVAAYNNSVEFYSR